ncbi:MAG: glycosyltransferase [Paludibacteraceae bacterium]|nr:glycosyltransferase [Paludibacteraceae bacterium]
MNKACIIISVYKNVDNLKIIIQSLKKQTEQDFEVIISEDGEDEAMAAFIRSCSFPWHVSHLTQPDMGWGKNRMLNKAISVATAPWLIFIDGDCVLHPKFVEEHLRYSAQGRILAGKRVKLNLQLSQQILAGNNICLLPYIFRKRGCQLVEEGFYLHIAHLWRRKVRHLTGSNMSMSKVDIVAINGFDENYTLPAIGEDYDIEWRLQMNGCKIVSLRNLAIQYHLFHKENWTDDTVNMDYFRTIQQKHLIICKNGITKNQ